MIQNKWIKGRVIMRSYVCNGSPGLGQTRLPEPGLPPPAAFCICGDTSDINSHSGTQKTIQPAILAVVHSPGDAISCSQHGISLSTKPETKPPPPLLFLVKMPRDRNEITRCFSGSPLEFLYVCHWRACCALQLVKHHIEKSPVGAFHSWCLICVDNNSVYTHVARSLSHAVASLRIKRTNKCFLL